MKKQTQCLSLRGTQVRARKHAKKELFQRIAASGQPYQHGPPRAVGSLSNKNLADQQQGYLRPGPVHAEEQFHQARNAPLK